MNLTDDLYAAVRAVKPGQYVGQVRSVSGGGSPLIECPHVHRSRSIAMRCAERLALGTFN